MRTVREIKKNTMTDELTVDDSAEIDRLTGLITNQPYMSTTNERILQISELGIGYEPGKDAYIAKSGK